MTPQDAGPGEAPQTARLRRALAAAAIAAVALFALMLSIRSLRETREGEEKPPAAAAQEAREQPPLPTPTPDPGEPVSLKETASREEAPFAAARAPFLAKADDRGRIWVLDSDNSRIRVFDKDGGFLGGWGGRGNGRFAFATPEGLAISGNDLYVADTWNHRVVHYTTSGEWKGAIESFMGPRGVAVGKDGSVWVTDTGNNRLVRCDANLQKAETAAPAGSDPGQFKGLVSVAVGPSGNLYVTDPGNDRIQVLDANGKFLKSWSFPGLVKSWQARLEVDPKGTVYLANTAQGELLALDASGSPTKRWKDVSGEKLLLPVGLGLDRKSGQLYITDIGDHKLLKLALAP